MKKLSLIVAIFILILGLGCGSSSAAFAATMYSNVLDGLAKDATFTTKDYPTSEDSTLEVIQIAESAERELFVYVYSPSALPATSINVSIADDELNYVNYPLILLNSVKTLFKYKVQGVYVGITGARRYNISSIFRAFISGIDTEPAEGQTVSEVSFAVGKDWTVTTSESGDVAYLCQDVETIKVTKKHVGYVQYSDGYKYWTAPHTDSHYVAFNTDKYISKLQEADVYYVSRFYTYSISPFGILDGVYDEPVEHYVSFDDQDTGENEGDGWFGTKYVFNRIEKVTDFIADTNNNLTDEAKANLLGTRWILRFSETNYTATYYPNGSKLGSRTEISDVSILRLKFETAGKTYNLGVVDNKQTGPDVPDNNVGVPVWVIVAIVVACLLLLGLLAVIFKGVAAVLVFVGKALWFVISLPFKGIILLIRKIKERKGNG